jgi:hypothetical protein
MLMNMAPRMVGEDKVKLKDRIAIVTGAGSGIGEGIAEAIVSQITSKFSNHPLVVDS